MRTSVWAIVVVGLIASSAHAVDGVLEINQVCASGPGCFSGDTAGFPVQVVAGGGYRLTSNLTPPSQNVTLISVNAPGVHIDLNGFAIQGTNTYPGPGQVCTASGIGDGVNTSANDVSVANGHVRGMGSDGILLLGANSRVERVTAEGNCGDGIRVGLASIVIDSVARLNSLDGIEGDRGSRVSNIVADVNGGTGIIGANGDFTVEGCVANANGVDGVFVGNKSLVRGCQAQVNLDDGIAALGSSQLMENIANGNVDRGITAPGSPASQDSTALGLNVIAGNVALNLSGGFAVACNLIGGAAVCPP